MKIVFSDLDGTLLHLQTYSAEAALPAVSLLKERKIPVVFATSKTRAEVEFWRRQLGNEEPFIVENGGAIYIPAGYFGGKVAGARQRNGYEVIELGVPYGGLVEALRSAAEESGCRVLGFHDLSEGELTARTLLPAKQARLAKKREYDEPFEILHGSTHILLAAVEKRGLKWTRGDRFYHITGNHDKAAAVGRLTELYRSAFGDILTMGIGDGHNDAAFLKAVDLPVVVQSRFAVVLKRAVPRSEVTHAPGPYGWREAVLRLVG